MAARHAVNGVVDKNDGNVFAADGGMYNFGHTDRGQVSVALIGKHNRLRFRAFNARGNRRAAAMRALHHVAGKIGIRKYGAPNGSHTNDAVRNAQLIKSFTH